MHATTQTAENFGDHAAALVEQVRRTGRPITLTVEGIRQGLADLEAGRVRPAKDVFDEFRARHGIPH